MSSPTSYTVIDRDNCTLVIGAVPFTEFAALSKRHPKGAVLDTDLARMAGASFAFGLPAALAALREQLAPEARATIANDPRYATLSAEAREWLATGHQGTSSQALFHHLTGARPPALPKGHDHAHPHDLADFSRCLLLEAAVPEIHNNLPAASDLSFPWAVIITRWPTLKSSFLAEAGPNWTKATSAPKTHKLWQSLNL